MPVAVSRELQAYAGFCPSCGKKLLFGPPLRDGFTEAVRAVCSNAICQRVWSMVFDLDKSGTFGVMSFQCDNGDRVMSER